VVVEELVTLSAGEEYAINFYLDGVFDLKDFGPMATFIAMTTGEAETLSIELIIDPEEELELEFTDVITGALVGLGFSNSGEFVTIYDDAVEIPINGTFGFAIVGAIITETDTRVRLPRSIPCTIAFAVPEPEEEDDDDGEEEADEG
ncbi:hypothetical protein ACFL43_07515, partial [Thermodesulfobacteriota bacterium]